MTILPESLGSSAQVPVGRRHCDGSQATSSNELLYDFWPYLGKAHQRCGTVHPPVRPPHPLLSCLQPDVAGRPPLRVGTVLPAQDSYLKDCPGAEAAILPQCLRH